VLHRFTLRDKCSVSGTSAIAMERLLGDSGGGLRRIALPQALPRADLGVVGRQSESVPSRASFICDG
jgi:hypothetical protein